MDDNNNNIFEVLESPSPTKTTSKSTNVISMHRSQIPLMNAGNGLYSSSQIAPSSSSVPQQKSRKEKALQDLGFVNPGPKNLVNVASVPARRLQTRQTSAQDKPNSIKPVYDESGLLLSNATNRCDCNRLTCPGCFLPCTSCQSPKCGLECRNLRTYTYEYRLHGTNIEITQEEYRIG